MGLNKVNYVDGSTVITAQNLNDIQDAVIALEGQDALTNDVKQALLQIASKVAYIDDDGQDYYDALESALYPDATLVSISAVYTQSGTVYVTDSLDSLKSDLIVTALYSDATTATITAYTLSGTLTVGTSTITVSYGGKTDTFTVTVSTTVLYELQSTFTSTGTESINTNVKAPANGALTIAIEYSTTSFDNTIRYVFSTKKSTVTNYAYCALQNQYNASKNYTWGAGISWTNGANLVDANNVVRMVILITTSNNGLNLSAINYYRNITKNTSATYTNTYTAEAGRFDEGDIYLGQAMNTSALPGFTGHIDKFIVDSVTWDSTQIDAFLAGE